MAERMSQAGSTFIDPKQREVNVAELLQGTVTTGSNLLDAAQAPSWEDLNHQEQMNVATSLMVGLEESAFLLADILARELRVVHEKRNICELSFLITKNTSSGFSDLKYNNIFICLYQNLTVDTMSQVKKVREPRDS